MNIGKSIQICQVKQEVSNQKLAQRMEISVDYLRKMRNREDCSASMLSRLSDEFGLKASEFVALGE